MPDFDITNVRDAVNKAVGVQASTRTLISEFVKELNRIKGLPTVSPEVAAELDALVASLNGSTDGLAADVEANPDPNPND